MNISRCIITGGATGIGLEMARELLKNGAEKVCIADVRKTDGKKAVEELKCEYGECSAMFLKCDVTKKSQMNDVFKCAMEAYKGLDVVINNAGILDDKHWERQISINLTGLVRGSLLAMKYMGRNNGGCGGTLVNLSSILGMQPMGSIPVYVATKHAVLGFSRSLGMDFNFCRSGVRVLTICPGVTMTPMITEAHKFAATIENAREVQRELGSVPSQEASCVAKGLMYVLKCAKSGSIWVTEGGEPIYEVEIPDRLTLRKC